MGRTGDFSFSDFNAFSAQPAGFEQNGVIPPTQTNQQVYSEPSSATSPTSYHGLSGTKRKSSESSPPSEDLEEASRVAAEEDKRRRNTAASARFRVKKKQREQALEKSAKDMSDKVSALENRINTLETENKWLKNLITEKNGKEDVEMLWKKYNADQLRSGDRIGSERKDGVGTKA